VPGLDGDEPAERVAEHGDRPEPQRTADDEECDTHPVCPRREQHDRQDDQGWVGEEGAMTRRRTAITPR
jgi:hypothetical protein